MGPGLGLLGCLAHIAGALPSGVGDATHDTKSWQTLPDYFLLYLLLSIKTEIDRVNRNTNLSFFIKEFKDKCYHSEQSYCFCLFLDIEV